MLQVRPIRLKHLCSDPDIFVGFQTAEEVNNIMASWTPALLQCANLSIPVASVSAIGTTRSGQQLKKVIRAFAEHYNRQTAA